MLTDRDISMAAYTQGVLLHQARVTSAMSRTLVTAKKAASAGELRQLMATAGVRRVPIVYESNCLCGVVGLADVVTEAVAAPAKDRKRGTSAAMLVQLMDALLKPARTA
jgi:CBS-domain-containing membrane protein